MGTISAKHLKQKTGEVIRRVKSGERLTLTYRGKPIAIISPPETVEQEIVKNMRPFEDAWKDIEQSLEKTKPKFEGWQEATAWARNRS